MPSSVTLRLNNALPGGRRLDKSQAKLVQDLFEHLSFLRRQIAARLLIEQHQNLDHLGRTGEIRLRPSTRHRIREIAEIVAATFPGCNLVFGASSADNRSYRVSFDKIRKHLPVFKCAWDAKRGAVQLYELFKRIDMTPEVFQFRTFTRLKQLEYLIKTQQIDDHFFWKK